MRYISLIRPIITLNPLGVSIYNENSDVYIEDFPKNCITTEKVSSRNYATVQNTMIPTSEYTLTHHLKNQSTGFTSKVISDFFYNINNHLPDDVFRVEDTKFKVSGEKLFNTTQQGKDFITSLKVEDLQFKKYLLITTENSKIDYQDSKVSKITKISTNTIKELGIDVLSHLNHRSHTSTELRLIFENSKNNAIFIFDTRLLFESTNVSCGVSQMFDIDQYFQSLRSLEMINKEFAIMVEDIVIDKLKTISSGAQLLISTRQKTISQFKKYWLKLTETYKGTTRYTLNNNSGYKIGTTLLTLR